MSADLNAPPAPSSPISGPRWRRSSAACSCARRCRSARCRMLTGCDLTDDEPTRSTACCGQCRAGTIRCRRRCSTRTGWRRPTPRADITRAVPVQRLLSARTTRRSSTAATYKLEVSGLVEDKSPWTLARLRALPQTSQITRHICVEGWSAIGKWGGVAVPHLPGAHRRRHAGQICRLPLRRQILLQHRHGDGAASADAAGARLRAMPLPPKYGYPAEAAGADQARLQEPEADRGDLS